MKQTKKLALLPTLALLAALTACGGGGTGDNAAAPSTDTSDETPAARTKSSGAQVSMTDNAFSPATLTVKPGQTITIVNKGGATHNLVDEKDSINSGDVEPDANGTVKAPTKAGTYSYVCTYHFGMKGTFKVT
jgi:plastocyanin